MKERRYALMITLVNFVLLCIVFFQGSTNHNQPKPDVVRARLFEVLDDHGTVRAQIKVESNPDAVVLRLRDASGNVRVKLGADSDGSGMVLANGSTEPGVHILSKKDNVKLALTDNNGRRHLITP